VYGERECRVSESLPVHCAARLVVVAVTPEVPAHAAQDGERNHDRSQDDERGRLVAARREERERIGRATRYFG
jgi:hypothetical protein